jgi:hypothetical protein
MKTILLAAFAAALSLPALGYAEPLDPRPALLKADRALLEARQAEILSETQSAIRESLQTEQIHRGAELRAAWAEAQVAQSEALPLTP